MISFLSAAIISLSIISPSSTNPVPPTRPNTIHCKRKNQPKSYKPEIAVESGEYDLGYWTVNMFIGRHQMLNVGEPEYLGIKKIQNLTTGANGKVFSEATLETSVTLSTSETIATSTAISYEVTSSVSSKISGYGASVASDVNVSQLYTIQNTLTYSFVKTESVTMTFQLDKDVIGDNIFRIVEAAYIYKIPCVTWQYDDYWWGKTEVSGSRFVFDTYVIAEPFITVEIDGELVL